MSPSHVFKSRAEGQIGSNFPELIASSGKSDQMNIILNSYCNLKCNYCFADEYMEETVKTPDKSMDFDFFTQDVLPRIRTASLINFMGGEPTLHPRFNDILSSALENMQPFSFLGIFTNGLMPDKSLDLLLQTVGKEGCIQKQIQFSVLMNWQTRENISEKNHERCREVANQLLSKNGYGLMFSLNLYSKEQDLSNRLREGDIDGYLLKPMNCPMHIRIFDGEPRSYRDLPVRLAEFGTVYRYEQSGELGGMLRVRGFTQDDAHIFCTEEQVQDEIAGCLELVQIIFKTLGIDSFDVRVGLRDPNATKYVGNPEVWDRAEDACRAAAETLGDAWHAEEGEAAFYGPKIDFIVRDAIGRSWQLGTVQVDYNLPERFDLSYIGADNAPHRPVMIHRAPFGSMERFVGFLIEHFAGAFPAWLAPEQVRVLPVSEKSSDYASNVYRTLRAAGQRVTLDEGNERLQARIRVAAEEKIPYLLIVGPRDAEAGTVSVRARGTERDLGAVPLQAFVDAISTETEDRCDGVVRGLFGDSDPA